MYPISVIIVGGGAEARRVLEILESDRSTHVAIGWVEGPEPVDTGEMNCPSIPHLGTFEGPALLHSCQGVVLASEEPSARREVLARLHQVGLKALTLIHPRAIVSDSARIGQGVVVHAGAVIEAKATIGKGARVGSLSTLGVGCRIGDSAFIGHGVHCGSESRLGEGVSVGYGSVILDDVLVGPDCVIGPSSQVADDILAGSCLWELGTVEREISSHPELDQG